MANSTSTPYYGPDEPAAIIFAEHAFLASDLMTGIGYGIQLVLYSACARYLWSQRHTRRHALFIIAYITIVFSVETVFVGAQARAVQLVYIDNRNFPGGPWAYFLTSQKNVMLEATLFVITFMCDALVLWRCWVIWQARGRWAAYFIIVIPSLMLLASFVMGTLWTLQSSQPALSLYSALPRAYGISYYTISLSLNVVLTLLIVGRLLQYRASIMASLPAAHAKHYVSLATVLVESAALYSVFAVCFLITYTINSPINEVFIDLAQSAQQISAYLIIYRLADGKAWKTTTLARKTLSTMAFDAEARKTERDTQAISAPVFSSDRDATDTTLSISVNNPGLSHEPDFVIASEEGQARERERKVQLVV
ncbi:hypothetical protein PENSPDRAFT_748031 [Peniophora sp. CONT]|nr:hypothetical protein PENSPDRAFT_748031 [Peniophora sp. CONT]